MTDMSRSGPQTPFTCGYCPTSSRTFKETIDHLVTVHCGKEIKFKKVDGTLLRTLNYQIIPELCREQGREITLNEIAGTIHVSKPNKVPKDSPFKKIIKTSFGETNQAISAENPGPTCVITAEESDENFTALIEMLPNVIQTLKEAGKLNEFIQFNRLVVERKFPLTNIAFLLFLDTVRWFSLDDATPAMRYCEEVKEFWRTGLRLFHGRFLRFMGGPKNKGQILHNEASPGFQKPEAARVNFIVPDRRVLVDDQKIVESSEPGILYDIIETVSQSDPDQIDTYKICVDGQKINPCSTGEINLWGYEGSPTCSERQNRYNSEMNHFQDVQAHLEKLINFGHTSVSTLSEQDMGVIGEACKISVTVLSSRIKDLRQLKVKNDMFLQKLLGKIEGDWRSSTYCMVISSLRTRIYLVENCIDDLLQCNENLCNYAAVVNKVPHMTSDGPTVALQVQENLVCLAENASEEPHTTKQRTDAWKQFRADSLVTGSTINKAIGLDGLKNQKDFFAERFGEKSAPEISEELQRKFDYGTENEINAVATFVSTFLPAFLPDGCFYEEGCYPERKNGNVLLTVSPDGSVRKGDKEVICGIEIKCPFPGKLFTEPVQYVIPRYYICQILSEMHCLEVEYLYFLSYSKDSMAVLKATYDADLWALIFKEIECLDKTNVPKKLGANLGSLKEKISDYQKQNVTLIAEIKSKKAIECDHSSLESNDLRIHHSRPAHQLVNEPEDVAMSQIHRTIIRCGEVITQGHKLCVKKASEVLVFMLGDLNRIYKPESSHAFPIAYGFKGYSMSTETMRKMIKDVLHALFVRGIYAPVVSYDGQWAKLAFQAPDGQPLTILELQRQLYNEVKARSVTDVTNSILETNVVKADSLVDLYEKVDLRFSETGAMSIGPKKGVNPYRTSASMAALITEANAKCKSKDTKEKTPDTEVCSDPDLDYLISCIPTEAFAEADTEVVVIVREVGSATNESTVLSGNINSDVASLFQPNDESVAIVTTDTEQILHQPAVVMSNNASFADEVVAMETPEVIETVTVVTESVTTFDYNDVLAMLPALQSRSKTSQTWHKRSANDLHDIILKKEVYDKMTANDILICLEASHTSDDCQKVYFCKSWKKRRLANLLQDGFLTKCVTEKPSASRQKSKNPGKLTQHCRKAIKALPKRVLNAIVSEHEFPSRLEAWRRDCPFSSVTAVCDVGQVVWFSKPEYNPETFAHVFSCLDIHHLITNCRVKVCKDGFPERGIDKKAWIDVARSGMTNLKIPHVEDLVDKQSDSIARETFSSEVENVMRRLNYNNEANFCKLIREFYDAEDEPGLSAADRCRQRLALKDWLLEGVRFNTFPPHGSHIRGVPNVMFQGFLTNIDRRIQLFPYVKSGKYNVRTLGSLEAENFFGEFQDLDPKGTGVIKAEEVPMALETACQLLKTRLSPERSFHMSLTRAKVYPLHDLMEDCESEEAGPYIIPSFTTVIQPRDHVFDSKKRAKRSAQRKSAAIADVDDAAKGVGRVRAHHHCDQSKIMAEKRLRKPNRSLPFSAKASPGDNIQIMYAHENDI